MDIQAVLEKAGIWGFMLYEFGLLSLIACPALARVYVVGRYLNLIKPKDDKTKNLLGIVWMFILSFIVIAWFKGYKTELLSLHFASLERFVEYILTSLVHYSFAILYYAFICWKLFDKMKVVVVKVFKKI